MSGVVADARVPAIGAPFFAAKSTDAVGGRRELGREVAEIDGIEPGPWRSVEEHSALAIADEREPMAYGLAVRAEDAEVPPVSLDEAVVVEAEVE